MLTKNQADTVLDPVLHQPIRTRLVAFLVARGEATFTDGNLEAHMKKLKASGYITTHKQTGSGRPQTLYAVTPSGHTAFKHYIQSLQKLLNMEFTA